MVRGDFRKNEVVDEQYTDACQLQQIRDVYAKELSSLEENIYETEQFLTRLVSDIVVVNDQKDDKVKKDTAFPGHVNELRNMNERLSFLNNKLAELINDLKRIG